MPGFGEDGTWAGYEDFIGGVEELLPMDRYLVEVVAANPMYRDGVTGRAIFLDLMVVSGPKDKAMATVYVFVPEPGNRRGGGWYIQKMRGFGDLKPIYAIMPANDLQGALNILCAALIGRRIWAQIGPGNGEFSNKNSIYESWEVDDQEPIVPPSPEKVQAVEDSYARRQPATTPGFGAPATGTTAPWGLTTTPTPSSPSAPISPVWGTPVGPNGNKTPTPAIGMPTVVSTVTATPSAPVTPAPAPAPADASTNGGGAQAPADEPDETEAAPAPAASTPSPEPTPGFLDTDDDDAVPMPRF